MKPKFLRRQGNLISRLGRGRKKKQRWKKPTGRDNKMREKRKGKPAVVSIGYKQEKNSRGKILEKIPVRIYNKQDLEKIGKDKVGILGKIGNKNKIEIAKIAEERKIKIYNLNTKRFLRNLERKKKNSDSQKQSANSSKKEKVKGENKNESR